MKRPIQPIYIDKNGTARFKKNEIVCFLLDHGPFNLNDLAAHEFPREDEEQFAQLIGYSLSGLGELSYVSDETYKTAEKMHSEGKTEAEARIEYLEETLAAVRDGMRAIVPKLFKIHPDDLEE